MAPTGSLVPQFVAPPVASNIVALGASAGGLRALSVVLGALPRDFAAAVMIVQHLSPHQPSLLAQILSRCTRLQVCEARDGDGILPGRVYIAPPDRHLLVGPGCLMTLTRTALVRHVRPSVDLLFASVAERFHRRAIAVILSGSGADGSDGIRDINRMGGTVVVQEVASAEFSGMPFAAIQSGMADFILPLEDISSTLVRLVERNQAM